MNLNQLAVTANRENLAKLFLTLNAENKPQWGIMEPQQMVEHLIKQVSYTNGKRQPFCEVPEEQAKSAKQAYIYADLEIPKNAISGGVPDPLIYSDLENAINQLMKELEDFDNYFKESGMTVIHGGFGAMNYEEWVFWHSKHFKHHLEQFGLI